MNRSFDEIKEQKKKVVATLKPYKGKNSVSITHVKADEISRFISSKDHDHSLVSERELNNMKRVNYGEYYLKPKEFNTKIKKMVQSIAEADLKFSHQ